MRATVLRSQSLDDDDNNNQSVASPWQWHRMGPVNGHRDANLCALGEAFDKMTHHVMRALIRGPFYERTGDLMPDQYFLKQLCVL